LIEVIAVPMLAVRIWLYIRLTTIRYFHPLAAL